MLGSEAQNEENKTVPVLRDLTVEEKPNQSNSRKICNIQVVISSCSSLSWSETELWHCSLPAPWTCIRWQWCHHRLPETHKREALFLLRSPPKPGLPWVCVHSCACPTTFLFWNSQRDGGRQLSKTLMPRRHQLEIGILNELGEGAFSFLWQERDEDSSALCSVSPRAQSWEKESLWWWDLFSNPQGPWALWLAAFHIFYNLLQEPSDYSLF